VRSARECWRSPAVLALLGGEERHQNLAFVADEADERAWFVLIALLDVGVSDDNRPHRYAFYGGVGVDDLRAVEVDQDVLDLRRPLLEGEETAGLAGVGFRRQGFGIDG